MFKRIHAVCFFTMLTMVSCATYQPDNTMSSTLSEVKLQTGRYGEGLASDSDRLYVFAGGGLRGMLSDVEIINPKTHSVEVLDDRILPRRYFSAVFDGQHSVFLLGGISETSKGMKYENQVEVFDTQTNKITHAAPLPYPTRINSAVYFDGKIYVVGGALRDWDTRRTKSTSLMAVYDIASDTWSLAPPMPTEKDTSAVLYHGKIYVVGGYNGTSQLAVFEVFDPKTQMWSSLKNMPQPISAHTSVVWKDKLFTFGDYANLSSVWAYDFKTTTWQKANLPYKAARHAKAAVIEDTVYVVGGNRASSGSALDLIQKFDAKQLRESIK